MPIVATGGYNGESPETPPREWPLFPPPGLGGIPMTEPDPIMDIDQFGSQSTTPHTWIGNVPDDIVKFDFALTDGVLRRVLYGDDK